MFPLAYIAIACLGCRSLLEHGTAAKVFEAMNWTSDI